MTTTHAFRQALHIPWSDPEFGEIVGAVVPGAEYMTDWIIAAGTPEAPIDGQQYGRQASGWTVVGWTTLAGKPSTFPPMAHTHAQSEVTGLTAALANKADLSSPTFTGDPKAPTPTAGDNDTSIATTAFVTGAVATAVATREPAIAPGDPTYFWRGDKVWAELSIDCGVMT